MNTRVTIRRMALAEVTPADYNPRKALRPGDREYEQIKASLGKFGLVEPLIWNRRTKRLVGGHQRLAILLSEGETETDVSVVDLDEAQEKALNVALNRTGLWDFDSLPGLLEELSRSEEDLLRVTGYDAEDVADLLRRLEGPPGLEELEGRYGSSRAGDEEALWPALTVRLPRETLDRLRRVLDEAPGADAEERAIFVCEAAEEALGAGT